MKPNDLIEWAEFQKELSCKIPGNLDTGIWDKAIEAFRRLQAIEEAAGELPHNAGYILVKVASISGADIEDRDVMEPYVAKADYDALRAQFAALLVKSKEDAAIIDDLIAALNGIFAITDRMHVAWDRAHEAVDSALAAKEGKV